MKVLFAVSNDNVSASIIKKYQEKYKEIITSKNVYYFNAIIKELQKDKTYDSIVIGEDLEPISNNNYDTIDKFIFDKLDGISDEASKPTGEDIPIILICSDRRTKSDGLLVKLFGIGVYNALLGNDRNIDMVCNLINKPRNKKEAKSYYKIDSEDVNYKPENESEVSETEIQNILNHYKKIGNNEKKCIESFNSIAEQYNDTQLRIIVKFLPLNVKAILETGSEKYQKLMTGGTVLSNGKYNKYNYMPKDARKQNIDFLTKDLEKTKLTKPVIIPSTMNIDNANNNVNNNINNRNIQQNPMQNTNINNANTNQYLNSNPYNMGFNIPNYQNTNNIPNQNVNSNFNNMNFNTNNLQNEQNGIKKEEEKVMSNMNNMSNNQMNNENVAGETNDMSEKEDTTADMPKRRGRPKKIVNEENVQKENIPQENVKQNIENNINETPKRGRGRPKKVSSVNQNDASSQNEPINLFGLEELSKMPSSINSVENTQNENNDVNNNENINLFAMADEKQENNINNQNINSNPYNSIDTSENIYKDPYVNNMNNQNSPMQLGNPYEQIGMQNNNPYGYYGQMPNAQEQNNYNNFQKSEELLNTNYQNNMNTDSQFIAKNGKIIAFVGTSKNGTSFIVNNLAELLSQKGIKTAILDLTKNKNSYYMFTDNDQRLMSTATNSIKNLIRGNISGVEVNKNLTVFTSLPGDDQELENVDMVLQNLDNNYSAILMDCDFETNINYFVKSTEIYLVQSMDALTIQPLTLFLSELKLKNSLDERKLRVIINKEMKLKVLNDKMILGGMAKYNEPSMTLQRDLFDPNTIKYISIPFEEQTYARYIEAIALCKVSLNGYSERFLNSLQELANMVYPLLNSGGSQNYSGYSPEYNKAKKGFFGGKNKSQTSTQFSSGVNGTLNKMRTNY